LNFEYFCFADPRNEICVFVLFFSFLISSTLAFGSGFSDEECSGNLFENGNYFLQFVGDAGHTS